MLSRIGYLPSVLAHLFAVVRVLCKQRRVAYNRIHRRANIVRHIGQEVALCRVCVFGNREQLIEPVVHLPLFGAVGEHGNYSVLAVDLGTIQRHVEPYLFVFAFYVAHANIAFPHTAVYQFVKPFGCEHSVIFHRRGEHLAEVGAHFVEIEPEQFFDVCAYVFRLKILRREHYKHIASVFGEHIQQPLARLDFERLFLVSPTARRYVQP